jgi:hypothetical protein
MGSQTNIFNCPRPPYLFMQLIGIREPHQPSDGLLGAGEKLGATCVGGRFMCNNGQTRAKRACNSNQGSGASPRIAMLKVTSAHPFS